MARIPRFRLPNVKAATIIQRVLNAGAPATEAAGLLDGTYAGPAGNRPYKLYVPPGYRGQAVPLIVMLHGCTQSPADFAAGTGMNAAADKDDMLVLYPAQIPSANPAKCWNWFNPQHQRRGQGEPALIAGMTHMIMQRYKIDPRRVYVAGLSAGGAAAAIMAEQYPDIFAAAAIHSGLACGAATDMMSAMAIMRQGHAQVEPGGKNPIPVIIFQGDSDTTVHPSNIDAIRNQFHAARLRPRIETGEAPNGHRYTRTLFQDADGISMIEQWLIHGAGHAWSGGSAAGSFTDGKGPDATREMLRFFLAHPKG